ncbi:MAG: hypothetical protein HZB26_04170 [Candidatus Hydrogenedentes bacterium]|nr:hypothetical protein [Candidatus Hydrogenedentota bacterium]
MTYFDYQSTAREAGIPDDVLAAWRAGFEREYPQDAMMLELRLLRACQAARGGDDQRKRVVQALEEEFRLLDKMPA